MALTLNGTNQWPSAGDLIRLGEGRRLGIAADVPADLRSISDALSATIPDLREYGLDRPDFATNATLKTDVRNILRLPKCKFIVASQSLNTDSVSMI